MEEARGWGGTVVLEIVPGTPTAAVLERAAGVLRRGGIVGFPTETFYGLGAAAFDGGAVARIFELKGRPREKPILVLVDSLAMVETVAADIPEGARALMDRHWPGPLTLVLRARPALPGELTAGTGTIGVRLSAHPVARGLVQALGQPVTAPSANPSALPPPTRAAAVLEHFAGAIEMVVDGGPTRGGEPSTVLDVTVDPPRLLRPGALRL